jgi:hypothetical protein
LPTSAPPYINRGVILDILFTVFLATSIAIVGCLIFEAATQTVFSKDEPQWSLAIGGVMALVATGAVTAVLGALGGAVS